MNHLEHLRGADEIRIIMVCLGNICRSPSAEAVMRERVATHGLQHVVVDSAGTGDWHQGDGADRRAVKAWESRGYEHAHRARQFQSEWFTERELILVMDEDNRNTLLSRATGSTDHIHYLREFDPALAHVDPNGPNADALHVPDPYFGGPEGFEEMLDMIERACDGLVERLQAIR